MSMYLFVIQPFYESSSLWFLLKDSADAVIECSSSHDELLVSTAKVIQDPSEMELASLAQSALDDCLAGLGSDAPLQLDPKYFIKDTSNHRKRRKRDSSKDGSKGSSKGKSKRSRVSQEY